MNLLRKSLLVLVAIFPVNAMAGQDTSLSSKRANAVNVAWANKDYQQVIDIMTEGDASETSEAGQTPNISQALNFVEYDRNIAAATGRGQLGDPCPILKRANDNLLKLLDNENPSNELQEFQASINYNMDEVAALVAEFGCAEKIIDRANSSASGIYYLRGVMETGSGLRLMEDSKYQWFLSVGALDVFNEGVWQQFGNTVQLIADPAPPKPNFLTLGNTESLDTASKLCASDDANIINYALRLQPTDDGFGGHFGLISSYIYADGNKSMPAVFDENLQINVCLNKNALPNSIEIMMFEGDTMYIETIYITPQADMLQIIEFNRPPSRDGVWAHQLLQIKGRDLIASRLFPDKPYVRTNTNLAN